MIMKSSAAGISLLTTCGVEELHRLNNRSAIDLETMRQPIKQPVEEKHTPLVITGGCEPASVATWSVLIGKRETFRLAKMQRLSPPLVT